MLKFSVIMSIYKSDVPEYLHIALESLLNQTRRPDEIVIVGDGPVPAELEQEIERLPTEGSEAAGSMFNVQGSNALKRVQGSKLHTDSTELTDSITQTSRFNSQSSIAFGDDCHDSVNQASLLTLAAPIILNLQGHETVIRYLPQEKNRGLGAAMAIAVEAAQYPYLARMDSDDICLPDRFEKQMRCFEEDPELSAVGGMITEFVDTPENIVTKRVLPLEDKDIKRFMKSRCGVNHVTVIFKKEDLLKAGNYRSDYRQEDYYLWARMMKVGCKFRNIPDVVVNVRSGYDQFARRSGWKYYLDHCAIFRYMYREGLISWGRLAYNYIVRFVVQFLMPNGLRTWVYQHVLRK